MTPWDALWAALEDLEAARRERDAAAGRDPGGPALRYHDWWVGACEERVAAARDGCASLLLLLLRCATEERPHELWAKVLGFAAWADWRAEVQRFFSTRPGGTAWALDTGDRVRELEGALARAEERISRLEWALAQTEQRIGADHVA